MTVNKRKTCLSFISLAAGLAMLLVSGCENFMQQKPTELQTKEILSELMQVKENPNIKNPVPLEYRESVVRVPVAAGAVKLYYFTKFHPPTYLQPLLTAQTGVVGISSIDSTNQMIIHCADNAQADEVLKALEILDFAPIQVNIDCIVVEQFADTTMDWETTTLIEGLAGSDITLAGKAQAGTSRAATSVTEGQTILQTDPAFDIDKDTPIFGTNNAIVGSTRTTNAVAAGDIISATDPAFVRSKDTLLPAFPGASLREEKRKEFGLDIGYFNEESAGERFKTVIDVLISKGYLKVLMNPRIETMNGQTATILSREQGKIEKIVSSLGIEEPYNLTEFVWVEDTLVITPRVHSDGSITLKGNILIGSRSKPEGVVQTSVITKRTINITENRILPGKSLVIGGIRKSERRSVIRGVPFLKDIPIIGILFSSKDFEQKGIEVTFILTPSISSGSISHAKAVEGVREAFSKSEKEGMIDTLTGKLIDPMGTVKRTEELEAAAEVVEVERSRSEADLEQAMYDVERAKSRLEITESVVAARTADAASAAEAAVAAAALAEQAAAAKAAAELAAGEAQAGAESARLSAEQAAKVAADAAAAAEVNKTAATQAITEKTDLEAQAAKAAEEAVARQAAAAKAKADADAAAQKLAELKAAAEESAKKAADAEQAAAARKAAEEEAKRKAEEEAARIKAQQEEAARLKAQEEEAARVKAQEEEAARQKAQAEADALAKQKAEEEAQKAPTPAPAPAEGTQNGAPIPADALPAPAESGT